MHVTAPGKPAEYLTLAGMAMADFQMDIWRFSLALPLMVRRPDAYMEISHL